MPEHTKRALIVVDVQNDFCPRPVHCVQDIAGAEFHADLFENIHIRTIEEQH